MNNICGRVRWHNVTICCGERWAVVYADDITYTLALVAFIPTFTLYNTTDSALHCADLRIQVCQLHAT
jgi:hypothetical protein